MATGFSFSEEEMVIEETLGYPRVYPKLCRKPHLHNPYNQGPPFTFFPYILHPQEDFRASDFDRLFPVIDPDRKPSANPRNYTNLLWKQLNHLGNAGFDPAKFRVDMYGNVLYIHGDSGSPLAWEIDHWFPCSRGGGTVPSNLRLLQWQVCKKKQNKLEFLVPWWDLQLGISVNQFLSIFASTNLDFRKRAFSLLFLDGENEELNHSQVVESHAFPQHFIETESKIGLAPAAIVFSRRDVDPSALKSFDLNRPPRPNSPATVARKFSVEDDETLSKTIQRFRPSFSKENDNYDMGNNQYLAIAMARNSLKQKEETEKKQAEIQKLDDELMELKQKNETERLALQDLESVLIKRRRRVEKCRRLAEAQSSYRALIEKMIRDAMHQSVVYKEQIRLNQAASSALMARLEAQKAICDSSEKELHRRFKQRDEMETQIRPYWEQARKRSRMDDTFLEERYNKTIQLLPGIKSMNPLQKELRLFLEEEQKASEAGISLGQEREREQEEEGEKEAIISATDTKSHIQDDRSLIAVEEEIPLNDKLQKLTIKDGNCRKTNEQKNKKKSNSLPPSPQKEEDEEDRKKVGKVNVDKWLQMLLENTHESSLLDSSPPHKADEREKNKTEEIVQKLNQKNPQKQVKMLRLQASEEISGTNQSDSRAGSMSVCEDTIRSDLKCSKHQLEQIKEQLVGMEEGSEAGIAYKGVGSSKSFEGKERGEKNGKETRLARCESARAFKPIPSSPSVKAFRPSSPSVRAFRPNPSSPSVILGMRRGVDCMGKKPLVIGDDEDEDCDENHVTTNKFIKTSIKNYAQAIKKAVTK
ncbi:trichohyalin [Tasmannia lanceolata]|uniref:trichohyalin n=1 Tax=Tasmannia lanceolata TaxID=3420 RepID=UPI0040642DE0